MNVFWHQILAIFGDGTSSVWDSTENRPKPKRKAKFQASVFRGYVSWFQEDLALFLQSGSWIGGRNSCKFLLSFMAKKIAVVSNLHWKSILFSTVKMAPSPCQVWSSFLWTRKISSSDSESSWIYSPTKDSRSTSFSDDLCILGGG